MLISFSVKNFMCFKDKIEFDMQPVGSEAKLRKSPLYDSNVHIAKTSNGKELPLLSSSVLYGANASGKSSFFNAIQAMDRLVASNNPSLSDYISPFKLDKKSATQPSEFEITILAEDNVIYEYGFTADQALIHKEYLYAYPKGRIQKLYERTLKASSNGHPEYDYQFGPHLHGNKKIWGEATTPHRLFLATAIQLNNTQLKPVYNWFLRKTYFIESGFELPPARSLKNRNYTSAYLNKTPAHKKQILTLLSAADFDIVDITANIKEEDATMKYMLSSQAVDHDEKNGLTHEALAKKYKILTYHRDSDDNLVEFDFDEESDGTKKIYYHASALLDCLEKGGILFVDEIDNSLHPLLVRYIIDLFNSRATNPNGAQLIFTTHDSSLLHDDELLRHDQIWFCDKNKQQQSELYSLSEFKKPRKDHVNYEALYLSGRYGAIPFIKSFWPTWDDKNA